ncbi:hypothetical protein Sango_1894600 [Sesamum angolense]|uniref:Reverse transcriptase domain-containing protein n=1 Tax=Sesamum angolense TaxID=2727404 RepID=A0AAE1WIQ9_9LAMI|nr:hypothetical protein Sango_1894600 [Sesamum angolense]
MPASTGRSLARPGAVYSATSVSMHAGSNSIRARSFCLPSAGLSLGPNPLSFGSITTIQCVTQLHELLRSTVETGQHHYAALIPKGLPMRCALKVDLRKAYDTVEWDFLSAVLQMFGFPGTFIGWVEECVTTPMFSYASMGTLTVSSRFQGVKTRGSDVLVLVRSDNGADVDSVRVFRQGLDEFAKLSGLHANPQKSQLILSRSAQDVREQLLAALHFQEVTFPSATLDFLY